MNSHPFMGEGGLTFNLCFAAQMLILVSLWWQNVIDCGGCSFIQARVRVVTIRGVWCLFWGRWQDTWWVRRARRHYLGVWGPWHRYSQDSCATEEESSAVCLLSRNC